MNEKAYLQLAHINAQLLEICDWLNQKRDFATPSRLLPVVGDLTVLVAKINMKSPHLD